MARSLKNKPNVVAPDGGDFPFGRIEDKGVNPGTPVNEEVYGDMHQFFEALMDRAGVVHNEMPESDYQGFQFLEALVKLIWPDGKRRTIHRIPIGAWNMDSTQFVSVPHTEPDYTLITLVAVSIIPDAGGGSDGFIFNLARATASGVVQGQVNNINASDITLIRTDSGQFDSSGFDDDTMNRGYITYIVEREIAL